MDVADDAEGVGGEVLAQRDVVDGSPPLEAQARGGDRQVRAEGGLERRPKASGVELRCPIRWLKSPTTTRRVAGSPFQQSGKASQILLVVLPHLPVPGWTHARAGVGNADADHRYLANVGLGDAGHKSPGR